MTHHWWRRKARPVSQVRAPKTRGSRQWARLSLLELEPRIVPVQGLTPQQIDNAYNINLIKMSTGAHPDGTGQTIAIIDAGDQPNIVSDLASFDSLFGLPAPPNFLELNENGGTTLPAAGTSDETIETSLDVEWAHAIAPGANIILYEAASLSDTDLFTAVQSAKSYSGALGPISVLSMSFGGGESQAVENTYDVLFTTPNGHRGITFLASTGDEGGGFQSALGGVEAVNYPAVSPNVVAVGGTTFDTIDSAGDYPGEVAWGSGASSYDDGGSGGGISLYEQTPSYQSSLGNSKRTIPDVSFDADPNTGPAIYDSYMDGGVPQFQIGGTSFAAPAWAGIIALADQSRSVVSLGTLNGETQTLPDLYKLPSLDFHDITSGSSGYSAKAGYDFATGLGTPIASRVVGDLWGQAPPTANGDTYSLYINNTLTVPAATGVLANDTDPLGETLTVVSNTSPSHGMLTLNSDGSFTYTPTTGYTGADSFTYTIADTGTGVTSTATVQITVKPTQADLAPETPSGWSGPIVASIVNGGVTQSATITDANFVYVNWAFYNGGGTAIPNQFQCELLLDGGVVQTVTVNPPFGINASFSVQFNLGQLSAGSHTLEVILDDLNQVSEATKSNNTYTDTFTVSPGPVTQLVVTAQPPSSVTAGNAFGFTVKAEDAFGVVNPTFTGNVVVSLLNNPSGTTLGGTLTATAVSGVATFSGLTIDIVGADYTIQAVNGSLTTAITNGINVSAGAATQLIVTTQPPSSVTAGAAFGLVVVAADSFGNVDPTYNSNISVAIKQNPGGSTLGGTTTVAAVNGIATFTNLTLNIEATGYTLQTSSGTLSKINTSSFNVVAGGATQLAVTTQPPSSVTAGKTFGLVVAVEDSFGNVATSFSGNVTLTLANNPGGGPFGGTLTLPVVNGLATYTDLTLDIAANGYTINAVSGTLTTATTATFNVVAGTASQLVIATQPPSTVAAGAGFGVVVNAEDSFGNLANFTGSVTIALNLNPGGSTLGGTPTVNAVGGVATFSGLNLNLAATGYTLQATSGTLASATTNGFNVVAAATSQLVVTTQPSSGLTAGSALNVVVAAEDAFGNLATSFTGPETVSIATNAGGGTLSGTLTVNAVDGQASFSGLSLNRSGIGYALQVSSNGLTTAVTNSFNVIAGAASILLITSQPPGVVTAGSGFGFVITADDALGNVATSFNNTVTLALFANPGNSSLGGATTLAAVNGVVSFSGLTLNHTGTGYTIQAISGNLTRITTNQINVTPGATSQLIVTTQPPSSATAGTGFGLAVTAEDSFGNLSSTFTGSETVSLVANPGGGTLGGTTTVTAVAGVATFSGLSLNKAGTGYTLQVTSGALISGPSSGVNIVAGAATTLLVTSQPPATVGAGGNFGLTLTAEDTFGNVATSFTGSVALALSNNPTGGVLGGTTSVTATNGVAAFTGLFLDLAGTGYTLKATSQGLTAGSINPINVVAGLATQLVVTTQPPSSLTAGTNFGLVITAEDSLGNTDPTFAGSVTIGLASNPGTGSLGGTLTATAVKGVATFAGLNLTQAGAGYTIQATNSALTSATTNPITVNAGAATQLILTSEPPAVTNPGTAFGLTVVAEDSLGNVNPNFNGLVTATLTTNGNTGTLGGTVAVNAINGGATFTNLSLSKAGTGYVIQVSSNGLSGASTTAISVNGITSLTLSNASVLEFRPDGTGVGSFTATEATAGHTYTYALVSGTGSSGNGAFALNGNQLVTTDAFDYSVQTSFSIRVRATDESGLFLDQVYTIAVVNDPTLSRSAHTLTVSGTAAKDSFSFVPGSAQFLMTYDGVNLAADTPAINAVVFQGNGGIDTANVTGLSGVVNTFSATPNAATLSGTGYSVRLAQVANITAHGGANDIAYLYDTLGNSKFAASPLYAYFQGAGFYNQAAGFGTISGFASSLGNDAAYLYDATGSNNFVAKPTSASFQGTGFFNQAVSFPVVNAYSAAGTVDTAYLYDAGGNNVFIGTPTYSYLQSGATYFNQAVSFRTVNAFASSTSNDAAYFFDNGGTNTFNSTPTASYLQGSNYLALAMGFKSATATAGAGANDSAFLLGSSSGGNVFTGTSTYSYLYGPGYVNEAVGYKSVTATAGAKTDTANYYDGIGTNVFSGQGANGGISVGGIVYSGSGFGYVNIVESQGTYDQTVLSSIVYTLTKYGTWH